MMGSSNLTENALVTNHEWNLKVSGAAGSDLGLQLADLVNRQIEESVPLTAEWISAYAESYKPPTPRSIRRVSPAVPDSPVEQTGIVPNAMQQASASRDRQRACGGPRQSHRQALATGTGKTILSALDVRAADPVRLLFVVHASRFSTRQSPSTRASLVGMIGTMRGLPAR